MIPLLLLCTTVLLYYNTVSGVANDCFTRISSCTVDDHQFSPYNVFSHLSEAACIAACSDTDGRGILANENGQLVEKFCTLAQFSNGICKLYHQEDISVSGTKFRHKRYGESGNFGSVSGSISSVSRSLLPGSSLSGSPLSVSGTGSVCYKLKLGQPGCTTSGANGIGTGDNAIDPKFCYSTSQNQQLNTNAAAFYLGVEFAGTVDDCKAKCKSDSSCSSLNYYYADKADPESDPAQCVLHNLKCSDASSNTEIQCQPASDTEYYEKNPVAIKGCQ